MNFPSFARHVTSRAAQFAADDADATDQRGFFTEKGWRPFEKSAKIRCIRVISGEFQLPTR